MSKRITELTSATVLAETDLLPIVDISDTTQATSGTTKKSALSLIADYLKARVETLTNKTLTSPLFSGSLDGWISAEETWAYASADAPTFVITVPSGAASKYSVGMKLKLTQTTVKYFIITAVADTTLTVYGGTDYTLANEAITLPYYSMVKSPLGFPVSPAKWTVSLVDDNSRAQASPTQNAWYNLNSSSISVPIGVWNVQFSAITGAQKATDDFLNSYLTLSTANNSASTSAYTSRLESALDTYISGSVSKSFVLTLTSKTAYYVNTRTTTASVTNIYRENLQLFATCAYL